MKYQKSFEKDPSAVLQFKFDWKCYTNQGIDSDWLAAGETISSYVLTVPTGITKDSDSQNSGVVTVKLSGGTAGTTYAVACKITTSAGNVDKRTMDIQVRDR